VLIGLLVGVGCAHPPMPHSVADVAGEVNDDGGEIQSADAWKAEAFMWRKCPRGFTVVKSEEVAIEVAPPPSTSFDRLAEPNELTDHFPATARRTQFKCAHPTEITAANTTPE